MPLRPTLLALFLALAPGMPLQYNFLAAILIVVFGFFSRALWLGGRVQVHADCRVLESNSNAPRFPELCQLARAVNIAARDPCL